MYLENKTEIFYSKNIEIQFRNMYTHFKKGMVKNMKNWKKIMAGLCVAAMVSSMVVPVWAAEETTEEASRRCRRCIRGNVRTLEGQRRRYLRILQR